MLTQHFPCFAFQFVNTHLLTSPHLNYLSSRLMADFVSEVQQILKTIRKLLEKYMNRV